MSTNTNNTPPLPKGWVWTKLGEISIRITKGSTPTSYGFSYKNNGIKFIKTENIKENGTIGDINDFIDEATNTFLQRSVLKANDILFSIAGTIGRVGLVQEHNLPANTNQALGIIRCHWDFISNKYIFHFLKSPFIQKRAVDSIVGVGRANISLTNLSEFQIPLSPLPEQHRIVAKIEELFTKLDAGVEALKKVKAQIKRYRQAVLKYAFEGKLTAQWRARAYHDMSIEPTSILLEKIKEQRKKEAKGKYKELPPIDTTDLPELPEGWVWVRLGEVFDIYAGGDISNLNYSPIKNEKFIYPIYSNSKENNGLYGFSDTYKFPENSITITGRGNIGHAIPRFEKFNAIIRLLVLIPKIELQIKFVSYFINSFIKIKIEDSSIPQLTKPSISNYYLLLPPLPEQHKIVEEIERRFSIADSVEKIVDQSLKQAERLRQSILKRAFEGKLVPQDPNDEPAEKLLERIKSVGTIHESSVKRIVPKKRAIHELPQRVGAIHESPHKNESPKKNG